MLRRFVLMLTAAAGWLLLTGTNAHAGLITETVDQSSAWLGAGAADTAPSESPSPRRRSLWDHLEIDDALFEASPSTSGSMTGHSASGPTSSPPVAAIPAAPPQLRSQLISRLNPENSLWTPPPFLSGIFRPPRQ